jgi:hypothetical protein
MTLDTLLRHGLRDADGGEKLHCDPKQNGNLAYIRQALKYHAFRERTSRHPSSDHPNSPAAAT